MCAAPLKAIDEAEKLVVLPDVPQLRAFIRGRQHLRLLKGDLDQEGGYESRGTGVSAYGDSIRLSMYDDMIGLSPYAC